MSHTRKCENTSSARVRGVTSFRHVPGRQRSFDGEADLAGMRQLGARDGLLDGIERGRGE